MSDQDPHHARRREIRLHRAERRRAVRRRRVAALVVLAVVVIAFGLLLARIASGGTPARAGATGGAGSTPDPASTHAASTGPASDPAGSSEQAPPPTGAVTISAVGDTMIGTTAEPAPNPSTYFSSVRSSIPADVAFANLEGTLTNQTSGKCASLPAGTCYEFKLPPSYAKYYKQAGFTMMSNGNNHAFDFWQAGLNETVAALDRAGLDHTGRTTEITNVDVRGIRTAWIGFGPYPNNAPLNDSTRARQLIHKADANADIVVVSMHAGAEGSGAQHLTGADEIYYGENRGNPEAFARMAVDAGADLVLGSGPHVLRAMEFYKKRLIAYSLGDFAGYHNFGIDGVLGVSAILRVKLDATGKFLAGRIIPVRLVGAGQPVIDSAGTGISVVSELSREDIGARAPRISPSGVISEP
jgi:hypothetical protein